MDTRGNNGPLIAAGGGALLLLSLFIQWFEGAKAWELFDIIDVLLALIALAAVAIGGMLATGNTGSLPANPSGIVTTAGIVAFSVVATFVLEGDDHKFGVFLALISTIAMIVGGMQLARGTGAPAGGGTQRAAAPPPPPPPAPPTASPPPPPPSSGV